MLNTSIALLTIFIPIAILLFEIHQHDKNYSILDRAVILDYLIEGRYVLTQISLLYIPLLFWLDDHLAIKKAVLFLWILGLILAGLKLRNLYRWIRGNRFYYRFAYLKLVDINAEMVDLWRDVWNAKDISQSNENDFFNIFKDKVSEILRSKVNFQLTILLKLLQDFHILINRRNLAFLTYENDAMDTLLNWHVEIWEAETNLLAERDDLQMWGHYSELSREIEQILIKILKRVISEGSGYGFFKILTKHIELHKTLSIKKENKEFVYIEDLLGVFYPAFFETIESSAEKYDIWKHYFPEFLKIKINTLEKTPAIVSWNEYRKWAVDRIRSCESTEDPIDIELNNVSEELFPETDPVFWSIFMTFNMRSWGQRGRIRSLIECPRNFGIAGRLMMWNGTLGDVELNTSEKIRTYTNAAVKESIKLLVLLLPYEYTPIKLEEYIKELEGLSYKDVIQESYRQQILGYMNEIKKHVIG